ncbi:MAG: hypothetical protein HUU43_12320 [Ignavibacteriaceae bacterium]|nr:hypothetical protein [Ignavibacteriaceae bacterium]
MRKIVSSFLIYIAMILAAITLDYLLHAAGFKSVGRYFGFLGTAIVLSSFIYSMRKRKMIKSGTPKRLLQNHEFMGWLGAVLIIVHGGIHFNAMIPWAALFAMMIVVGSGLTGKFLLASAKEELKGDAQELRETGMSDEEVEKELLVRSLLVRKMQNWRKVHMPLTMILAAFALLHIVMTLIFWRW